MFQLSLMLARVSLDTVDEPYRQAAADRLLGLLRDKPASNIVPLFRVVGDDEE